jgi:hypothetical protein
MHVAEGQVHHFPILTNGTVSARPRTSESGLVEFVGDWGFPGESRDDIVLA